MNVVLDANVLLSGLVDRASPPRLILLHQPHENLALIVSEHIAIGVRRALEKPYWKNRSDRHVLETNLKAALARLIVIEPVDDVHGVAADEEDDLVLATAVAAHADYLVTGDRFHLGIGEFRGIPIVSPRDLLDRLDAELD